MVTEIVEKGVSADFYAEPIHPYSKALLSAVPIPDPEFKKKKRIILKGDVPSPINPPSGCRFHPRCPHAMGVCRETFPEMKEVDKDHLVACYLY